MAAVLVHAGPVLAAEPYEGIDPACGVHQDGTPINRQDGLKCGSEGESDRAASTSASASGTNSGSAVRYVAHATLATGAEGQPCVRTVWRPEGSAPVNPAPDYLPLGGPSVGTEENSNLYTDYPPCPLEPGTPANLDTPQAFAARFWETVPLPRPNPYIAPGWAITGKLAYVETRGKVSETYTNANTPFGTLEITATGRYYVDWGDGEASGPHSMEGKPWPEGQITHDYIWARTYDIVVTERWTATWRFGSNTGVLRELRTTGRIDDFPARQIQVVVGPR
ncbi:MAG: hypothetical protein ACRD12_24365 [Acidimicrobiales bacterium]